MESKPASSNQFCRICWTAHQSRLSSDQEMASTYSFYNSRQACWAMHVFGAVGEQNLRHGWYDIDKGGHFYCVLKATRKNTPWHRRFEWKRDLCEWFPPVPARPINRDFVQWIETIVQTMQNSNFAIPASNADAVLLDSVSYWRQFGYFSGCSLWTPRRGTNMLVEIDYIHQGLLPND